MGCDVIDGAIDGINVDFNPRTPGGVRHWILTTYTITLSISIHAPRVGCDLIGGLKMGGSPISIHAPRVGCDTASALQYAWLIISIHAPRVGCDGIGSVLVVCVEKFQSTHPGWGATAITRPQQAGIVFQSTHPGWGVTGRIARLSAGNQKFQSTHPGWGATVLPPLLHTFNLYFNPRTPGGVRLRVITDRVYYVYISIHAPRVGCDSVQNRREIQQQISIHAPRVGCDAVRAINQ